MTAKTAKELEIPEQIVYRCHHWYNDIKAKGTKRLKELEKANLWFKRIVADEALKVDAM